MHFFNDIFRNFFPVELLYNALHEENALHGWKMRKKGEKKLSFVSL